MKRLILITIAFFLVLNNSSGQTWDGGGDGHSWNDPNNWDNDQVPQTGDLVKLKGTLTIDGTAPNNPGQIKVTLSGTSSTVTLDLDVSIGDGTIAEHAIILNADCSLIFGTSSGNRTFNINTPSNKNGINTFSSQSNTSFTIASSTTLNISNGQHAINIAGTDCSGTNNGTLNITNSGADGIHLSSTSGGTFTNNGTISISGVGSDGIESTGTFTNSTGSISIADANTNGIYNKTGAVFNNSGSISITNPGSTTNDGINSDAEFNNNTSGTITISKPGDDCIEQTSGTFTNDGTITVTIEDAAGTSNNGIAVGTSTSAATFINNSNNSLIAHGGTSTDGRSIYVYESGTLTNNGTITADGGNTGATIYNRGSFTNSKGGTIDLTTDGGRINANQGTFTNDGLIQSSRSGPGVYTPDGGTSVNNGFADWQGNSSAFSNGAGTITDNGIILTNTAASLSTADDGDGDDCTADIANKDYLWSDGTNDYQASSTGQVTFSSTASSLLLKTSEYGDNVQITVNDICTSLPLEIKYVSAENAGDHNIIRWETISENGLDYFEIQKSDNAVDFESMDIIEASRGNNSGDYYETHDMNINSKINFYRLAAYDLNGEVRYSDIVSVMNKSEKDHINIYPTVLDKGKLLNVEISSKLRDQQVSLIIYDINGEVILKHSMSNQKDNVDLSGYDPGVYIIRIIYAGDIFTKKFFIIE